jgi:hypothetical protein
MSYSFVAAGAASSGSNTSRIPALPAGLAVGDYLLVYASIRNSGAGVPVAPAGYATLMSMANAAIFGKVAGSSEAAPTVTFTGGVANADTLAQTAAFRGYRPTLAVSGTPTTTSGTGSTALQYPVSPTSTAGRVLAITAGWKQDDWASITGGPGAQIGTVVSTVGDDAAQVWNYELARTAPAITGSWSTPGGVSANIRSGVLWLLADPVITVTEQASWPPRTQVAVTSLDAGDNVEVYRVVAGVWTLLRAGSVVGATDPSFLVVDAELPFGVPVSYAVYVNGFEHLTGPATYDLPGGRVALSDAITGGVAEAIIGSAGDRVFSRRSARFQVNGRNLVVSRWGRVSCRTSCSPRRRQTATGSCTCWPTRRRASCRSGSPAPSARTGTPTTG